MGGPDLRVTGPEAKAEAVTGQNEEGGGPSFETS